MQNLEEVKAAQSCGTQLLCAVSEVMAALVTTLQIEQDMHAIFQLPR